jgi:membrane protein YqaA with SNARE-associated domain
VSVLDWVLVWAVAVALNVVPAFAPPTWVLLAYFRVHVGMPLLPLAAVGTAGSVSGRWLLARLSRDLGRRWLSRRLRENLEELSEALQREKRLSLAALLAFCVGPLPSNELFIAAGLAKAPLAPLLAVFGSSRFVAYVLWVGLAGSAAGSLEDAVKPRFGNWIAIATELAGVVGLVLLLKVDWLKVLHRWLPARRTGERADVRS